MDVQVLATGIAVGLVIAIVVMRVVRFIRRQREARQEEPHGQREVEARESHSTPLVQEDMLPALRNRLVLARTAEDTFAIYAALDPDSPLGKEALAKAIRLGDGKLASATTIEECVGVIDYIPRDDNPTLLDFRRRVFERAVLVASSTDGMIELLERQRGHANTSDPKLQDVILERSLAVASSLEDAITVFDHATSGSDLEVRALNRIEALTTARLATATTFEECEEILALLPESEDKPAIQRARNEVVLKMVAVAETTNDVLIVLQDYGTPGSGNDLNNLILRRALALVTTGAEASEVYAEVQEGSDLEREVLAVWTSTLSSVEECQQLWEDHGTDTECGKLAILRAAEILSSTPEPSKAV